MSISSLGTASLTNLKKVVNGTPCTDFPKEREGVFCPSFFGGNSLIFLVSAMRVSSEKLYSYSNGSFLKQNWALKLSKLIFFLTWSSSFSFYSMAWMKGIHSNRPVKQASMYSKKSVSDPLASIYITEISIIPCKSENEMEARIAFKLMPSSPRST